MKKKIKLRNKYIILVILIIIPLATIIVSNARYSSKASLNNNLDIAQPIIELTPVTATTIENMIPGQNAEYKFNVKNTNDTTTNQVLLNYYIKISYDNTVLPLTYSIYDITDGNEIKLDTDAVSNQTNLIDLGFGNPEEHDYKIIFTWPESENNVSFANKEMSIDIDVYAEQVIN